MFKSQDGSTTLYEASQLLYCDDLARRVECIGWSVFQKFMFDLFPCWLISRQHQWTFFFIFPTFNNNRGPVSTKNTGYRVWVSWCKKASPWINIYKEIPCCRGSQSLRKSTLLIFLMAVEVLWGLNCSFLFNNVMQTNFCRGVETG